MSRAFEQLTLSLPSHDEMTFDSFFCNDQNQALFHYLQRFLQQLDWSLFIWGASGLGKTHLLQALCHQASLLDKGAMYLSLAADYASPEMLIGLEHLDLICLDDVHIVAGDTDWEHALFHCYNRIRESNKYLVMSAYQSPKGLDITLADLASRLCACTVFKLQALDDTEKLAWMLEWSKRRSMPMPEEVANYLLTRLGRSLHELVEVLTVLEQETLSKKRKLTLPFAKDCIGLRNI